MGVFRLSRALGAFWPIFATLFLTHWFLILGFTQTRAHFLRQFADSEGLLDTSGWCVLRKGQGDEQHQKNDPHQNKGDPKGNALAFHRSRVRLDNHFGKDNNAALERYPNKRS